MIVIHTIGGPRCNKGVIVFDPIRDRKDDATFRKKQLESNSAASIHFVVGRDGTVANSVPEMQVASHAAGVNDRAIGIELVNRGDGKELFSDDQLAALDKLVQEIRGRYPIPLENIVGHQDVDQRTCTCGGGIFRRRVDPNIKFSIEDLRKAVGRPGEVVGKEIRYKPLVGASGVHC